PLGATGDRTRAAAQGPASDDQDAHLRRAYAHCAAPEEDFLLYAEPWGRGHRNGPGARPGTRRYVLSLLSSAESAFGQGRPALRADVPAIFQRVRSPEGAAAACDVLHARAGLLLDIGQPRHAIRAGGGLGH